MKVIIEKELCNPISGKMNGPFYHVYIINNKGEKILIETCNNISEAARCAEHEIDWNVMEVAYQEDPKCFSSVIGRLKL